MNFSIDKYLDNPDFCAWALGDETHKAYWEQYIQEHPEEREAVMYAKKVLCQGVKVEERELSAEKVTQLWGRIEQGRQGTSKAIPKSRSITPWWTSVAAALLVMALGIGYWLNQQSALVTMQALAMEQKQVKLPDGSEVMLNAYSTVEFSEDDWENDRRVTLQGEAFFKVKKGSTFSVETPHGEVSVLGTSFNIYTRDNDFKVVCYTGKVQVASKGQKEILTKGEKVDLTTKGKLQKQSTPQNHEEPAWISGTFDFEQQPLIQVFEEIERQFGVEINAENLGLSTRYYTGTFMNNDLELALLVVLKPMGLSYQVEGKKVQVFEKK
ncbi:FecR family protein [Algivirga pacifica]|uniref:FecR domain-containing protein n=1 Tax=Algivirga pacifica TaxID=1162670 RepID=A0ABP9D0E4_9BACT